MSSESMMRIFKVNNGKTTVSYHIRDSHINIAYGECSTAATTVAKVVVLTDDPGWKLKTGSKVTVKFTYSVPANATLNVAGTGAKNIYFNGSRIGSIIAAGDVVTFDYDGTQYIVTSISSVLANVGNKLNADLKGAANGLAELDSSGKVPSSQLPSYVDDVLEYTAKADFPTTGEAGKIYVDKTANLTYRWSGSAYVEISKSLALGTTSSTAYRGDRGQTAYNHAAAHGSEFSEGLYKITTNAQGHVTAATAVAKADITALGIPGSDTNTHRPIQLNGTQILGNNTTALNLTAGSNVSVTNSDGTVTISATDTTYSSKAAANGGTDVSLVTTGEKYTWNAKTSNTGTVTSVATGVGLTGGTITGSGTIKAKLKTETAATNDSANASNTSGRQYPVVQDKSGYLSVNVPWTDSKPVTSVAGKTGAVTLAKGDVGLDNVDNKSSATIRSEITSSNVTTALGFTPLNAALKGANSGVAELDTNGKVPSSQLPSFVDDVLEYDKSSSFPTIGETGKIYIAQDTNKTYRWSGTAYAEISASLALGETSSTAYRGDRGKTAYDHAAAKGSAFASGLYKITTNAQGHVTAATAVAKSDITALGIPGTNTTYSNASGSAAGLMSAADKTKLDGIAAGATSNSVYDGLDSTSSTSALSAAQGKVLNDNIAKLEEGIAIIVDGDTAAVAVPVGGYAYVKNNTHGLAEGLYKNTSSSAFPVSGGTADSTVFTAVPKGAVNDAIDVLNRKFPIIRTAETPEVSVAESTAITINYYDYPQLIPPQIAGYTHVATIAESGTDLIIVSVNKINNYVIVENKHSQAQQVKIFLTFIYQTT